MLTIYGRVPSKKNSRKLFVNKHSGRIGNLPSSDYQSWHQDALMQLIQQKGFTPCKGKVQLTFFAGDKRKFDLTNKAESIMDLLVDAGYLKDDNYSIVGEIVLKFGGLDREKPRVEITYYD